MQSIKILVLKAGGASKDEVKAMIDQEVEDFSAWMVKLPDDKARGALIEGEKALLRTYLMQKYKGEF
jgi:hypothetical protein